MQPGRFILGLGGGLGGLRVAGAARQVAAVSAIAACGGVAYVRSTWHPERIPPKDPSSPNLVLARPAMEAICGGVGEVAAVCVLYPLETVKVKCQADGVGAAAVLRALLREGVPAAARLLYSGFASAALCSLLVGGVHYASFCVAKRSALQATGGAGDGGGANLVAATVGALATALVESPVELFRHRAQAGNVGANFLQEMASTVRTQGVGGLYWGFVPFLIESFPYDITELGTYSQLHDLRAAAATRRDATGRWVASVPEQAWDLAIGAAAGVASVLVSMPFDVIKVHIQTHGAELAAGAGAQGQLAAFWATGGKLVARGGAGALFIGLAPRLVQQVPSTTICWWAIERSRQLLEPFTKP
ncbi:SAMC1 [Scenedesmus sp. PABB004]|nr:SAMC1 [Scenedesmus sp. PABB004]